jgi:hypothetical protein
LSAQAATAVAAVAVAAAAADLTAAFASAQTHFFLPNCNQENRFLFLSITSAVLKFS